MFRFVGVLLNFCFAFTIIPFSVFPCVRLLAFGRCFATKCQSQFAGSNYVNDDTFQWFCIILFVWASTMPIPNRYRHLRSVHAHASELCSNFVAFDSNDVLCSMHIVLHTLVCFVPMQRNSDVNTQNLPSFLIIISHSLRTVKMLNISFRQLFFFLFRP